MQWVCDICGYVHDEEEPPDTCPVCGAPKSKFSEWTKDEDLNEDGLDDDDSDDEHDRY
jgi:rRNA maturation endonuclease Nob1